MSKTVSMITSSLLTVLRSQNRNLIPDQGCQSSHPRKSPKLPNSPITTEDATDAEKAGDADGNKETNGDHPNGEEVPTAPPPGRPRNGRGGRQFVNPDKFGTKAAAHYVFNGVPGKGGCVVVRLKLTPSTTNDDPSILDEEMFDDIIEDRRVDADEFYGTIARGAISEDLRNIMRQALSGMLW